MGGTVSSPERASGLSPEMALRIEKAFGVSMDTLMRMQHSYEIAKARRRAGEIKGRRHDFLEDERGPCSSACPASNAASQSVTPGYRAVSRTNSCPLEALCTVQ